MIILATNVVSEAMRNTPDRGVLAWLDAQPRPSLFVTTITEAEIRLGIAIKSEGRRRSDLRSATDRVFGELFRARVLPFDREAASAYAEIAANRRAQGKPISEADCQIAAITRTRGAAIATRNVKDFKGCGVEIIDPWQEAG